MSFAARAVPGGGGVQGPRPRRASVSEKRLLSFSLFSVGSTQVQIALRAGGRRRRRGRAGRTERAHDGGLVPEVGDLQRRPPLPVRRPHRRPCRANPLRSTPLRGVDSLRGDEGNMIPFRGSIRRPLGQGMIPLGGSIRKPIGGSIRKPIGGSIRKPIGRSILDSTLRGGEASHESRGRARAPRALRALFAGVSGERRPRSTSA